MKKNKLQFSYASISDAGERSNNEDYLDCLDMPGGPVFVLCDGLGGHGDGEVASRLVVEEMLSCSREGMPLEEAALAAQDALLRRQEEEAVQNAMMTTMTGLQLFLEPDNPTEGIARFIHVGDSRVYWFEREKYKLRSKDHSIPQMLVNSGAISEKEIRHHEDRSRLLRVMGTPWDCPKYQVMDLIPVSERTSFLLCSDGFWELIEERQMEKYLKNATTPEEWLAAMQKHILQNGKGTNMDNYSAIAVFVRGV